MDMQIISSDDQESQVKTLIWLKVLQETHCWNFYGGAHKSINKYASKRRMTMISMDGPNTNWCVLKNIKLNRRENELPHIIDVGSGTPVSFMEVLKYGLRWQTGKNKVWSPYEKLFQNSSARQGIYIEGCQSKVFPLQFCRTI